MANRGASVSDMKSVSGHKSDRTLAGYIEASEPMQEKTANQRSLVPAREKDPDEGIMKANENRSVVDLERQSTTYFGAATFSNSVVNVTTVYVTGTYQGCVPVQVANSFGSTEVDAPTIIVPPAAAPVQAVSFAATDFQTPSPTLTDLNIESPPLKRPLSAVQGCSTRTTNRSKVSKSKGK